MQEDMFNRDLYQVASEMPGHLPQQFRERYRHTDTLVYLTFLLLRISVNGVACGGFCETY